jgi:hypothetical protein
MRTAGRWLVIGWLAAALILLALDGRLTIFLGWTIPGSLLGLGVGALVRQQHAPSPPRPATPTTPLRSGRRPPPAAGRRGRRSRRRRHHSVPAASAGSTANEPPMAAHVRGVNGLAAQCHGLLPS